MRFDRRARGWVEEVTGSTVVRTRPLLGGGSSVVNDLVLADGRRLVLRRMDDVSGLDGASQRTRSEVAALGRLPTSKLVPRLVAADPDGERTGASAVLLTRVPGRPWLPPAGGVTAWVDGLAAAQRFVAELGDPGADLPRTTPWLDTYVDPPPWTADPDGWAWAAEVASRGLPPGGPDRLLHRDAHHGNVLFNRGRLSGIVDWEAMCRGPGELDVARCRVQVALVAGPEAADAFLDRCRAIAPAYSPAWDAVVACELSPWTDILLTGSGRPRAEVRSALDAVVVRAASG